MGLSFMRSLLSVGVLCTENQHLFIRIMMASLSPNYHHHHPRICPEIQVIRCKSNFDIQHPTYF